MSTPANFNASTDRTVSIVLIVVGVLITLVWAPISIMAALISDNGMNFLKYLGLYLMWFGPFLSVVTLGIIAIVKMARKQRAMLFGVLAGVSPIAAIILGFVIAGIGNSLITNA